MEGYRKLIIGGIAGVGIGVLTLIGSGGYIVFDVVNTKGKLQGEHLRRFVEINETLDNNVLHLPKGKTVEELLDPPIQSEIISEVISGIRRDVAERDSLGKYFEKELKQEDDDFVAHQEHLKDVIFYGMCGGVGLTFLSLIPFGRGLEGRRRKLEEEARKSRGGGGCSSHGY